MRPSRNPPPVTRILSETTPSSYPEAFLTRRIQAHLYN